MPPLPVDPRILIAKGTRVVKYSKYKIYWCPLPFLGKPMVETKHLASATTSDRPRKHQNITRALVYDHTFGEDPTVALSDVDTVLVIPPRCLC